MPHHFDGVEPLCRRRALLPRTPAAGSTIPFDPTRPRREPPEGESLLLAPLLWSLGEASRRFPCIPAATTEQVNHRPIERRNIVGLAARYEISVDHDLLIKPLCAGIPQVGFQRRPGRNPSPARCTCLDHGPGTVTNHCHRLAGIEEALH